MFPTHECVLIQYVDATDGVMFGRRPCRMPFAPFPGLKVSGHLRDEIFDNEPDTVEEVIYHMKDGVIELVLDRDQATESCATMEEAKYLYDDKWTWFDISTDEAERNGRG